MPCEWPVLLSNAQKDVPLLTRCKNADNAVCPDCARLHQGDIRTILLEAVEKAPAATFITLTAPGREEFGQVHSQRRDHGRIRRCACGLRHQDRDSLLGTPIDPDSYDYAAVADFNANSRALFSFGIGKLRRLTGNQHLQYIAVPEPHKRGTLHWHVILLDAVDPALIHIAFHGGINPRTGYRIKPSTLGRWRFGPQLDTQILRHPKAAAFYLSKYLTKVNASDRTADPRQSQHLSALKNAILNHHGACHCTRIHHFTLDTVDTETGEIKPEHFTYSEPRHHTPLPPDIQDRMSPWLRDNCYRLRRGLRQSGHIGRSFGRSRDAGPTMTEIRQRRCDHKIIENERSCSPTSTETPIAGILTYAGRGYGNRTYTAFLSEFLGIEPTKITHLSDCALHSQERRSAPPDEPDFRPSALRAPAVAGSSHQQHHGWRSP